MITRDIFECGEVLIPYEYHCVRPDTATIIAFPGTMMRLDTWKFLWEHAIFRNQFNLLFFEHHGQINASKFHHIDERYSVQENTQQLRALLEYLGLENTPAHLFGISGGCALLFDYALCHPETVRSIYFCGPFVRVDSLTERKHRAIARVGHQVCAEDYFDIHYFDLYSPSADKNLIHILRNGLEQICRDHENFAVSVAKISDSLLDYLPVVRKNAAKLKNLDVPKFLLIGSEDRVVPLKAARDFAKQIGAIYEEVEGAGHAVFFESMEYFLTSLKRFVLDAETYHPAPRSDDYPGTAATAGTSCIGIPDTI